MLEKIVKDLVVYKIKTIKNSSRTLGASTFLHGGWELSLMSCADYTNEFLLCYLTNWLQSQALMFTESG